MPSLSCRRNRAAMKALITFESKPCSSALSLLYFLFSFDHYLLPSHIISLSKMTTLIKSGVSRMNRVRPRLGSHNFPSQDRSRTVWGVGSIPNQSTVWIVLPMQIVKFKIHDRCQAGINSLQQARLAVGWTALSLSQDRTGMSTRQLRLIQGKMEPRRRSQGA